MDSNVDTSQTEWFHRLFSGRTSSLSPRIVESMCEQLEMAYSASESKMLPAYTDVPQKLHSIFTKHFTSAVEQSAAVIIFRASAKRHHSDPTLDARDKKQPKV